VLTLTRDFSVAQHSKPLALCIGNFDGVHVGHQAILRATVAAAKELALTPAAMTFEPHPREFFSPAQAPARLSSVREKLTRMRAEGIAQLYMPRFNKAFASQSVEAFIERLRQMQVQWLMVGEDFRFGFKRAGGIAELRAASFMELAAMPEVLRKVNGAVNGIDERVSSTLVREALAKGDLIAAKALLGYDYEITGHVVHGDKLGRTLDFPTANVSLGPPHAPRRSQPPLWGVYAVKLVRYSKTCSQMCSQAVQQIHLGAASLGRNPAVKVNGPPSLEVHLFDFNEPLYGEIVTVQFVQKLRDEAHYPTLDALKRAIATDCENARHILHSQDNRL
jgi:riboflavin kinase / FMN adenylyltransferase